MSKNYLIYLVIAGVVLIGLFYFLKPKSVNYSNISASTTLIESNASSSAQVNTNVKNFDLVVINKKLVSGQDALKVNEGDQVTINIINDEPEELHLHGYDKSVELEASKTAQLIFTANLSGRFPFELEKSKTELGALEVLPK